MKLRKENVSHDNVKLRILKLQDSGPGLGTRSLGSSIYGNRVCGMLPGICHVTNPILWHRLEEIGVPVAVNGTCLY